MKRQLDLKDYEEKIREEYLDPWTFPKSKISSELGVQLSNLHRDVFRNIEAIKDLELFFTKLHSVYGEHFSFNVIISKTKEEIIPSPIIETRVIKNLLTIVIPDDIAEPTIPQHKYFAKVINEYKKHEKYNPMMPDPILSLPSDSRKAFISLTARFENFRIKTLGINRDKFYRLVTEFIRILNGRKYYPMRQIFSEGGLFSTVSDEFIDRVNLVMINIAGLIPRTKEIVEEVEKFKKKLHLLKIKINIKELNFRSKDWYCIAAIQDYAKTMHWSDELLFYKLEEKYGWQTTIGTPEMILRDLVHGELDLLEPKEKKKSFNQQQEEVVRKTKGKWHEDFKKNEEEKREKDRATAISRKAKIEEYRKRGFQIKWGHLPEEVGLTDEEFLANEKAGLYDKGMA